MITEFGHHDLRLRPQQLVEGASIAKCKPHFTTHTTYTLHLQVIGPNRFALLKLLDLQPLPRHFYNQHAPFGVNPILSPTHSSRERVLQVCAHNKAIPSW